jgi:hypothetical protein
MQQTDMPLGVGGLEPQTFIDHVMAGTDVSHLPYSSTNDTFCYFLHDYANDFIPLTIATFMDTERVPTTVM